jgi:DNA ligase-associated metallophosphoesterase
MNLEIEWAGEKLTLMPERALWWEAGGTLFIGDPHFGKAGCFRAAGLAVPEMTHDADLGRLDRALRSSKASRLVILGDFLHAKTGRSETVLAALAAWRGRHPALEIILIRGNHDRQAGPPPNNLSIQVEDAPWSLAPFVCLHEPNEALDGFKLAAHWHPSFHLTERIGTGVNSPCFCFTSKLAILPAFGEFTGCKQITPQSGHRIFVVGSTEVIEITPLPRRTPSRS